MINLALQLAKVKRTKEFRQTHSQLVERDPVKVANRCKDGIFNFENCEKQLIVKRNKVKESLSTFGVQRSAFSFPFSASENSIY